MGEGRLEGELPKSLNKPLKKEKKTFSLGIIISIPRLH